MTLALNKSYHIKALSNGYHIGIPPSEIPYAHPNRCAWEQFVIKGSSIQDVILENAHGLLCCTTTGKIYSTRRISTDAKWRLLTTDKGYKIQSKSSGKFLELSGQSPKAWFYKHCNYGGWQRGLGVGNYPWVVAAGIPNDDMSSAKIGFGLDVTVYEHGGFGGRSWKIPSGSAISCFVPHGWNDKVSSVKITNNSGATGLQCGSQGEIFELTQPSELSLVFSKKAINICGMKRYPLKNLHMYSSQSLPVTQINSKAEAEKAKKAGRIVVPYPSGGGVKYYKKYTGKWPHCYNHPTLGCGHGNVQQMQDKCATKDDCHGFSTNGSSGCFKSRCKPDNVKGYGKGGYGYYEKQGTSAPQYTAFSYPSEYGVEMPQQGGAPAGIAKIPDSKNYITYNETDTSPFGLPYNLYVWSGGWANSACADKKRVGVMGVVVDGKMYVGIAGRVPDVFKSKVTDPCRDNCKAPGRGLNIVHLDDKGDLIFNAAYDTHANTYKSKEFTSKLNDIVASKKGIVIVGVYDEARNRLGTDAINAVQKLGGRKFSDLGIRGSYLMIYSVKRSKIVAEELNNCGDVTYVSECGLSCARIFDPDYYSKAHNELAKMKPDELQAQWQKVGLPKLGQQGSASFNVKDYQIMYDDVPTDQTQAAEHYMKVSKWSGRPGTYDHGANNDGLPTGYLQCYLDARYSASASPGSKQWKDLSGKNNHFNFSSPIVTDGFRVDMSSTGVAYGPDVDKFGINSKTNNGGYTIVMVCHDKSHSGDYPFYIPARDRRLGRGISTHICWPDRRVYFDNMGCCTRHKQRQYHMMGAESAKEHMYVFTRTASGGLDIYIDGKRVAKGNRGQAILPDLAGKVRIGKAGKWHADMKVLLMYNAGLPKKYIEKIWEWHQKIEKEAPHRISKERYPLMKHLSAGSQKDGLVLAIDVANKNCYPGKGTVVTDLARGLKFKLNKQAQIKNGAFLTNADLRMTGPRSSEIGISGDDDFTIVFRCKTNRLSAGSLLHLFSYDNASNRGILITPTWTNGVLYCDIGGCCDGKQRLTANVKANYNTMQTYVFTRDSKGRRIYIDGKLVAQTSDAGNQIRTSSAPMTILYSPNVPQYYGELSHLYIYNIGMQGQEVQAVTEQLNNPYVVQDSTWSDAQKVCSANGLMMCNSDEICVEGKAIHASPYDTHNALVPVGGKMNTWMNLDNCQTTNNTGSVKQAHVKCCRPSKRKYYFNSITSTDPKNSKTLYLFGNGYVATYDISNPDLHKMSKPEKMGSYFQNLPAAFSNPDTACIVSDKLYLFRKDKALVVNMETKKASSPEKLVSVFPRLKGNVVKGNLDSVIFTGYYLMFYKGRYVYIHDTRTGRNRKMYISSLGLDKVSKTAYMETSIDAATMINGHVIMYKGKYAFNLSRKTTTEITDNFMDLKAPFITTKQRCTTVQKLLPELRKKMEEFRQTNPGLYGQYRKYVRRIASENRQLCKHRNLYQLNQGLQSKDKRIKHLTSSAEKYRKKGTVAVDDTEKYRGQIKNTTLKISDLQKEIAIEKAKKCPTAENCKLPIIDYVDTKSENCDADMIKVILKNKGYTDEQIKKLSWSIDKNITASDFEIRKHGSFHQLVHKGMVKSCSEGAIKARREKLRELLSKQGLQSQLDVTSLSDADVLYLLQQAQANKLAEAISNKASLSGLAQSCVADLQSPKSQDDVNELESKTLDVLRQSMLKYHVDYVKTKIPENTAGKEELIQAKSINSMGKATQKMVCDLKVDDSIAEHLKVLKDIQGILTKTKNTDNYKKMKATKPKSQVKVQQSQLKFNEQVADLERKATSAKSLVDSLRK